MNLSQTGELESGVLSRQNTVQVQQSQHGGGRLWREDEYEGISHGVQSIIHGCEGALEGLEWLENALTARTTSSEVMGASGVEESVRKEELAGEATVKGTSQSGKAPGSQRTKVSFAVSDVRAASCVLEGTVAASSSPAFAVDVFVDAAEVIVVDGGKASMRPDVATAAPIAVPGRFGRGFGRKPDLTPTAGGIHHDCRTFGCFRQAAGPTAETAVGEIHCCLMNATFPLIWVYY